MEFFRHSNIPQKSAAVRQGDKIVLKSRIFCGLMYEFFSFLQDYSPGPQSIEDNLKAISSFN
jgi:hypothetical protein